MRKCFFRGLLAVFLILVVLVVIVAFSLGAIVKRGVERIGPSATKVEVKLKAAEVWLVGGRVQLNGFFLGNPPGYKSPSAMSVDSVTVSVKPGTVFSDKLVVDTINVKRPVITLEGGLTDNNLKKIEKNLDDYIGTSSGPGPTSPNATTAPNTTAPPGSPAKRERKLQVNDFVISGAKLELNSVLLGGKTITLSIPDIHLTNLGTAPQGITPVEVSQRALHAILVSSTEQVAKNAGKLGKEILSGAQGAGSKAGNLVKGLLH
jgi:uncharacterized protein involved in outer membrane biogenesis